jgi:hypothetical protein
MWLAHRTESGGAPDCLVRPSTAATPNGCFGGEGYKYPHHLYSNNPSIQHFIQYKSKVQHSIDIIQVIDPLKVLDSTLAH